MRHNFLLFTSSKYILIFIFIIGFLFQSCGSSKKAKRKAAIEMPLPNKPTSKPKTPNNSPVILKYGIDVSKHMGRINWKDVVAQDLSFVYMKATEGATYLDPMYKEYVKGAKRVGLPVGAYHFFRFKTDVNEQVKNFLANVDFNEIDLIPVLDIEEATPYNPVGMEEEVIRMVRHFLREVERKTGVKMMLYANENGYRKYIQGHFDHYPLWICSLRNSVTATSRWTLWQYSHKGDVEGINQRVDLNVFEGKTSHWKKLLLRYSN